MSNTTSKDEPAHLTQRGVQNPKVIDLIEPRGDSVVLQMIEDRPWSFSKEQLQQLGEKFDNYLEYVLAGWFLKHYPQYEGKKICFELLTQTSPHEPAKQMLSDMEEYAKSRGFGFAVREGETSTALR
ncbi:MAG: DUF6572 domain-containing protein [Bdellovibrionota bacterium]